MVTTQVSHCKSHTATGATRNCGRMAWNTHSWTNLFMAGGCSGSQAPELIVIHKSHGTGKHRHSSMDAGMTGILHLCMTASDPAWEPVLTALCIILHQSLRNQKNTSDPPLRPAPHWPTIQAGRRRGKRCPWKGSAATAPHA